MVNNTGNAMNPSPTPIPRLITSDTNCWPYSACMMSTIKAVGQEPLYVRKARQVTIPQIIDTLKEGRVSNPIHKAASAKAIALSYDHRWRE
jgi:hypothetical protein